MVDVRKGQHPGKVTREVFGERFRQRFEDPAYDVERDAIARLEEVAWVAYAEGRKAPLTRAAGEGHADPTYRLSLHWLAARAAIVEAARKQQAPETPTRVLVIVGSSRNDGSCPGEMSKSYRLAQIAEQAFGESGVEVDLLDLSVVTSEPHLHIHPCKGCVSTAMPLCHWPCSCYPNDASGQSNDWMNAIYPRWVAAHGVLIVTPVYWYQAPTPLKAMIDRLVCADGGNPDPTSTQGKDAARAKGLELAGWPYPKHLAGRAFGVVVHGDVAGIEGLRHALHDWLSWMGLVPAGAMSSLDRYVGYYEPYATSHATLDADHAFQEETRNAARAVARAAEDLRRGRMVVPDAGLRAPRPK